MGDFDWYDGEGDISLSGWYDEDSYDYDDEDDE